MRVADYIAERLRALGCQDVFMVTGGAAMHLNDAFGLAFGKNVHFLHHEQSCAIAAESYARVSGVPAVVNVTAGPGAINAINGVFGAYVDSIPMIVISGQTKRETMTCNSGLSNLRQLGDQEVDIVTMVSNVCKYTKAVQQPESIGEEIDHCFAIAISGRPGPVWLDIPIDVQATSVPDSLADTCKHVNLEQRKQFSELDPEATDSDIQQIAIKLLASKRPVLYVGSGVRISGSRAEFLTFLEEWPLATVTGWNSNDLLWDDHPCYCGRPGTVGNRAGNFAVQYADCVVTVGCRLNLRQISYNWKSFAKNAWRCHVDIDRAELDKPTLTTDLKVHATIRGLFPRLSAAMKSIAHTLPDAKCLALNHHTWIEWRQWNQINLATYPASPENIPMNPHAVNPYTLVRELFRQLKQDDITVCADGTACVVGFQAAEIKQEQRLFHNSGCASMGYDLPAAIGAYTATRKRVICIAGDGSIMMNLQELAIIGGLQLPIKIILLNNKGYHSIRQTQKNYFPGNPVGCGVESGLPFPDFKQLSQGFEIEYRLSTNEIDLASGLSDTLSSPGPIIHEMILDLNQDFAPKLSSKKLEDGSMISSELEDMYPFLGLTEMNRIREEAFSL